MSNKNERPELTYKIVKQFGVISTSDDGWNREFNLISWDGLTAKYDIRFWNKSHTKMKNGITLDVERMNLLCMLAFPYIDKHIDLEMFRVWPSVRKIIFDSGDMIEVKHPIGSIFMDGGFRQELNIVTINNEDPVFDIRNWDEFDLKCYHIAGDTFTMKEMESLLILYSREVVKVMNKYGGMIKEGN